MDLQTGQIEVTLTGDGLSLIRVISEHEALDIIAFLLKGGATPAVSESRPTVRSVVPTDTVPIAVSPVEFLSRKEPRTNPERMLVLGRYLEYAEQLRPFTKAALRQTFEAARQPLPKNFDRDLAIAIQRGWLVELRSGGLQVTQSGWTLLGPDESPARFDRRRTSRTE